MILVAKEIKLSEIMIDPYNPRYIEQNIFSQDILIKELLKKKYVKELLRSMQIDIKWVNRIVIQDVDKHEFADVINKDGVKYVVVEGNTRIACLKSDKIKGITSESRIPVLIAQKEKSETLDEYQKQIRITQGIANVTVVTEWGQLSKAKHLFKLYQNYKKQFVKNKPNQLYKLISDELGKTVHEIRQAIIRYTIFSKIAEEADTIPEDRFGYIEAFEKNRTIRALIGMDTETNEFELNGEEDDYTYEIGILEQIPNLIQSAVNQGINTKQFRDIIYSKSTEIKNSEELNIFIQGFLTDPPEYTFHSLIQENIDIHSENYWDRKMEEALETISSFPAMEDWAPNFKDRIKSTKVKLEKILKVF